MHTVMVRMRVSVCDEIERREKERARCKNEHIVI